MTRRAEPHAGFTLIELLVAITVLALLTGLLFGGLRFGTRVWRLGDEGVDRLQQTDAAFELMRRTLATASPKLMSGSTEQEVPPPGIRVRGRDQVVDFDGEPDGVSFVGAAPAAVFGGGLYRLTFGIVEQEGSGQLMFALQRVTSGGDEESEPAAATWMLLEGISRARFAYFGVARDAADASWYDRWQNQAALPELISVQFEFSPGDRRVWPQLLVAPMLSAPLQ